MIAQAIVPLDVEQSVTTVKVMAEIVRQLRKDVFKEGLDYGVIPGTGDKPTLYLPGMEKAMRALGLAPQYIERRIIVDYDKPLFHYEYECRLVDAETGVQTPGGVGIGLCTSMESSFRWRDAKRTCPKCGAATINRSKFPPRNNPQAEPGWYCHTKAGGCGSEYAATDPAIIGQTIGRMENPDIFDQLNAICKRAKKRALGDAVKGAANISEYFSVDLEDFAVMTVTKPLPDDAVEGDFTVETNQSPAGTQTGNANGKNNEADKQRLGNTGDRRAVNGSNKANGHTGTGSTTNSGSDDLRDKEVASRFIQRWRSQALSDSEVLAALGVTKLSEWTKGRKAADEAVNAWLAGELADAADDSAPEAAGGAPAPADAEGWLTYLPSHMTLQKRKDGNFMYILHTTSVNLTTFTADPFREAGWSEEEIIGWKETGKVRFEGQVEVVARQNEKGNWEIKQITR